MVLERFSLMVIIGKCLILPFMICIKEIPFFKLLLELGSLNMRVIIQGFDQEIDIYRKKLITDFRRKTTFLIESFKKIDDLCDDLYSPGNIETVGGQCMEIFRESVNNELSNFFVEDYTA